MCSVAPATVLMALVRMMRMPHSTVVHVSSRFLQTPQIRHEIEQLGDGYLVRCRHA